MAKMVKGPFSVIKNPTQISPGFGQPTCYPSPISFKHNEESKLSFINNKSRVVRICVYYALPKCMHVPEIFAIVPKISNAF